MDRREREELLESWKGWSPKGDYAFTAELEDPRGGEPVHLLLFAERVHGFLRWSWEVSRAREAGGQPWTEGSGQLLIHLGDAARECRVFAVGFVAGMKARDRE